MKGAGQMSCPTGADPHHVAVARDGPARRQQSGSWNFVLRSDRPRPSAWIVSDQRFSRPLAPLTFEQLLASGWRACATTYPDELIFLSSRRIQPGCLHDHRQGTSEALKTHERARNAQETTTKAQETCSIIAPPPSLRRSSSNPYNSPKRKRGQMLCCSIARTVG
jgi:hypothetical protein